MTKKLTKHGHSLALVIDRGVLNLLKIDEKTPLDISTDGRVLIVSPVNDPRRHKRFQQALAKSHRKFGRMYQRLARPDVEKAA
ncbi:MAG: AbrB family transcriptional regulator [Elusimicrobia bacterium RIFCSPLOWO2_01_FULL_59_12]|nr:MAG: AbrB family transcriptional regulator [Elusimicrobia bacterium RIFCSPLOWO2_01_FULL_59_12]